MNTYLTISAGTDYAGGHKGEINPRGLFPSGEVTEERYKSRLYFFAIVDDTSANITGALKLGAHVMGCANKWDISISSDNEDHLEQVLKDLGLEACIMPDRSDVHLSNLMGPVLRLRKK